MDSVSWKSCSLHLLSASHFLGRDRHIRGFSSSPNLTSKLLFGYGGGCIRALSGQDQTQKSTKLDKNPASETELQASVVVPSRTAVLKACTITSALMAALAVSIRQVSHFASTQGWPVVDSSADITFGFESWHLGLIMGSVVLVSSSRFSLLKVWPDFAESSEAANQQVLTSLEPLDYLVVAFLPGISEELLFRGAILPLFGINPISIFGVAALFGVLHLGNGRNYSFAIWATLVGIVYGYATIMSSSLIVPMASHALNNLAGGIIWRYSSKQIR